MDEQVTRHCQLKAGLARSLGHVVVVEEPQPKLLIKPVHRFVNRTLSSNTPATNEKHFEMVVSLYITITVSDVVALRVEDT